MPFKIFACLQVLAELPGTQMTPPTGQGHPGRPPPAVRRRPKSEAPRSEDRAAARAQRPPANKGGGRGARRDFLYPFQNRLANSMQQSPSQTELWKSTSGDFMVIAFPHECHFWRRPRRAAFSHNRAPRNLEGRRNWWSNSKKNGTSLKFGFPVLAKKRRCRMS